MPHSPFSSIINIGRVSHSLDLRLNPLANKSVSQTASIRDVSTQSITQGALSTIISQTSPPSTATNEKSQPEPRSGAPPAGGPPGPPGGWLSQRMDRRQEIMFNVMVAMVQIIAQSTLTTVFPISKIIAHSFHISNPSVLPWLVAAYALTFGTFILISGRLGDIFGHKTMVVLGFSILSIWSLVAGLSHYTTYPLFFLARGFQGLGSSMLVPNGLALLGRTYAPGTKGKIIAFSVFGVCAPVGAFVGFLFGSIFADFARWWYSFYMLTIVAAILAIMAHFIFVSPPQTPMQMRPIKVKLKDMDWLGALLGVSGLILIQVALVSAPSRKWSTPWIYFVLIIGFLLLAFFILVELRIAQHPLVPFNMLKIEAAFVLAAVGCGWAVFGIWSWFLWLWLLSIKRFPPLEAATHMIPMMPASLISSALTAVLMRKVAPAYVLLCALTAFTLGCILLAVNTVGSVYWSFTFLSIFITPWGMNMSFPASTLIMSNMFPPQQQGVAGSLITTVVNYSISFGLGLASTVEVHTNQSGRDMLAGIESGYYFGVGVGGLGLTIALAMVLRHVISTQPSPEDIISLAQEQRRSMRLSQGPGMASSAGYSRSSTLLPNQRSLNSRDKEERGLLQDQSRPPTNQSSRPASGQLQKASWNNADEEAGHPQYEYKIVTALPRASRIVVPIKRPDLENANIEEYTLLPSSKRNSARLSQPIPLTGRLSAALSASGGNRPSSIVLS